ncbi:MAG: enoyl-CoA hydratase [Chloroflexota bacterium]|nr:MAG: enoyl-CoA hydratase [Chloroflexota bacterium]
MTYENILYEVADGVATITLNRPEKYNAFSAKMLHETNDAFRQIARDAAVRTVIITGAGKAFCSGQDLGDAESVEKGFMEHVRSKYNPLILAMRGLEKPIIGAINGVVAGAGVGVALACDLRILSDKASFVFAAFVGIGLVPDTGIDYHLPRLVGQAKAFELIMLTDGKNRVSPQQALDLNLCTSVVENDALMEQARALAVKFATMPTRAIGLTKRLLNGTWDQTLAETLDMEAQLQHAASNTKDAMEGITAFNEKREPKFTGQ